MKNHSQRTNLKAILQGSALAGAWAVCAPTQALEYTVGDWQFDVDTTLAYEAQWRTESRDKDLEAVLNDNDGNINFDSGSMTSNKASFILEVGGSYEDFSFFIRGDGLYDYIYANGTSDVSRENFLANNWGKPIGGKLDRGEYHDETIDESGHRLRLLDAFVTYAFDVGDQGGSVKLGRQVISWGEATFYPGINAIQNPVDAALALSPGVESKTYLLPTSAIDLKWDFTDSLSAEAYYKWDWDGSTLPGVGYYMSTSDITGPGAETLLYAPGPGQAGGKVRSKIKPDDEDQYGFAARWLTDGGTNFELNYTKSASNIPGAAVVIDLANNNEGAVREIYTDNVKIWGFSFSTNVSEAQVYADIAYSENMPFVNLPNEVRGTDFVQSEVVRGHYWQVVAGFTDLYTAFPWLSEQITLLGEFNYQGNNLGGNDLTVEGGRYSGALVTDTAWGYRLRMSLKYFQVIRGMDVDVPIYFSHDVDGYGNSIALNNGLKEGVKSASIGFDAHYLTNWTISGKYAWFFGNDDPIDKVLSDRDNISFTVKYRF